MYTHFFRIFYLKSVWPHPQKASSIWNNSWISSIITVSTIMYIHYDVSTLQIGIPWQLPRAALRLPAHRPRTLWLRVVLLHKPLASIDGNAGPGLWQRGCPWDSSCSNHKYPPYYAILCHTMDLYGKFVWRFGMCMTRWGCESREDSRNRWSGDIMWLIHAWKDWINSHCLVFPPGPNRMEPSTSFLSVCSSSCKVNSCLVSW